MLYMELMFCPAGHSVLRHEYGIDFFFFLRLQEALSLCHVMENGCFWSAGSTVSLHVEWMFLVCRKHCVMSWGMDVFDLQETLCHFMWNG